MKLLMMLTILNLMRSWSGRGGYFNFFFFLFLHSFLSHFVVSPFLLGMCSQPAKTNTTCWVGSVFKNWWIRLGYEIFFNCESGWVWVITITTHLSWLDPPIYLNFKLYIFNIYLQIYFIINNFLFNFFSYSTFLYKTQLPRKP